MKVVVFVPIHCVCMSPSFQLEEQGAWVRFSKGDMKNAKDDVLPASTGVGDPSKANKLSATSVGQ